MILKELRKEKKYSQKDVAEKIGVSQKTISDYEIKKTEPDISTLIKLADLYNISMDELLERDFNKNYNPLEQEIINIINQLTPLGQGQVLGYAKKTLENEKAQKEKLLKITKE